jgi:hypothetical protein
MDTILSFQEMATYLRDACGSAETIEWATLIPCEKVHLIAQGFAHPNPLEQTSLFLLYQCAMFAPLEAREDLGIWLAEGAIPPPFRSIRKGDSETIEKLLKR